MIYPQFPFFLSLGFFLLLDVYDDDVETTA